MANDNKKVTNNKNKNTKTAGATKKAPTKKVATKKTTAAKKAPVTKTVANKTTPKAAPKKKTTTAAKKKTSVVTTKKAAKKVVNTTKSKNTVKKTTPKKNVSKTVPKKVENKNVPKKVEKTVVEPKKVIEKPKTVEEKVSDKKEEKKVTISTNALYTIIGLGVLAIVIVLSFVIKPSNSDYSEGGSSTGTTSGSPATQEEIPEDKRKELNSINIDQYLEMLKGDETKIIYIGRPTCSHCVAQKPIMENIAFEYDVTINYLNTDELGDDGINKLITSNEYFSEGFGTPLTLIVKNDEIVDKAVGETSKQDMVSLFKKYSLIK